MRFLERQTEKLKAEKYHGTETEDFFIDAERLRNGEPYEYVLGYVDFLGARIDLSLRPMIPRPETAFWVARAIVELKLKKGPIRLADTFSGAGNVALALLTQLPNATVDISELDPNLKAQIEESLELNHIEPSRAQVMTASALDGLEKSWIEPTGMSAVQGVKRIHGASQDLEHDRVKGLPYPVRYSEACDQDVLKCTTREANERGNEEMRQAYGLYDAVFAVPPYVPYDALLDLDPEMINHEPHLAFFAHDNGHEFHSILIEKGMDFLKEGGTLYMEADMDHNSAIREMVKNTAWKSLEFWPDPYGATPNVVLRK